MNDRVKIEAILKRIDALREEVVTLMPEPEIVVQPEPKIEEKPTPKPSIVVTRTQLPAEPPKPPEPTAIDRFFDRVSDWFAVRGDFAPKGMTREFAVATRWMTRIGALLLVGAMAYFLTLAISRGWIGPTQRVYGMMFWGTVGTLGGTWLKLKRANYAILGEVFAALGLVAFYLSFGLGHRYFDPPVIGSQVAAFLGLAAATCAAGALSVRLKSLMIASLALIGGFLVPFIASFGSSEVFLAVYLVMLTLGASAVAYLRCWTPFGYVAIVIACAIGYSAHLDAVFNALLLAQVFALTMFGAKRRLPGENAFCHAFVCLCSLAWLFLMPWLSDCIPTYWLCGSSLVYAALSVGVRRRNWAAGTGAPVLISWAVLYAGIALACNMLEARAEDWIMLAFALMAVVLGELGVRLKERTLEVFALILLGFLSWAFIALAVEMYSHSTMTGYTDYAHRFVLRSLYFLPLIGAMTFAAVRLCAPTRWLANVRTVLVVGASTFLFIYVSAESAWFGKIYLPTLKTGLMTIVWAGSAFGLLAFGIARRLASVRYVGLGLLGLSVLKLLFIDTASLATPGRVCVFAAVGILMIVGAFLYLKFKTAFEKEM